MIVHPETDVQLPLASQVTSAGLAVPVYPVAHATLYVLPYVVSVPPVYE